MGDLQKTNSQADIVQLARQEAYSIGHYGRLHRDYLKSHQPVLYLAMLQSGRLWAYLAELDRQAHMRVEFWVRQMGAQKDITEALKAHKPMAWVGKMENVRAQAEELVFDELIYR